MPQLDIYIIVELIIYSLLLFYTLYANNTRFLLTCVNLTLVLRKLIIYVEKKKILRAFAALQYLFNFIFVLNTLRILRNILITCKKQIFVGKVLEKSLVVKRIILRLINVLTYNTFIKINIESARIYF